MSICRLLNGMWQVSGAHGPIDFNAAIDGMLAHHDRGFTTWDLADHYGPAEDFVGEYKRRLIGSRGEGALQHMQAFTKWVPPPGPMTRNIVESNVDVSLKRMDVEALDMLQFHWWDYEDSRYLDVLHNLAQLRDEGKIRQLGLTNFDTATLERIADSGIGIVSNQVQYSLVDLRPEVRMAQFCQGRSIRGGWRLFQELLTMLNAVAARHGATTANVAVRYILDVRLGVAEHLEDNAGVFGFSLSEEESERIQAVTNKANDLFAVIGDCGDEYRR